MGVNRCRDEMSPNQNSKKLVVLVPSTRPVFILGQVRECGPISAAAAISSWERNLTTLIGSIWKYQVN